MGGWKLEVFRMTVYVAFPILMFHAFNNPEFFEENVGDKRRKMYPPVDVSQIKMIEDIKKTWRIRHDEILQTNAD